MADEAPKHTHKNNTRSRRSFVDAPNCPSRFAGRSFASSYSVNRILPRLLRYTLHGKIQRNEQNKSHPIIRSSLLSPRSTVFTVRCICVITGSIHPSHNPITVAGK
jgi:hypothetical protein